ncbi:MAG: stage II sporulation protein P [Lachnospiraceae bacterium]|nr:stage II sporulation protein P [Lachnospiraceae bacterium]
MKKRRLTGKWNSEIHIGRGLFRIALFVLCVFAGVALLKEVITERQKEEKEDTFSLQKWMEQSVMETWFPGGTIFFDETNPYEHSLSDRLVMENLPVFLYSMEQPDASDIGKRTESDYEELLLLEGTDEDKKGIDEEELEYDEDAIHLDKSLEEAFLEENGRIGASQESGEKGKERTEGKDDSENNKKAEENSENMTGEQSVQGASPEFHEVEEPAYRYQWGELQNYESLVKAFYAIDSTTAAGEALLNTEKLLGKDMRMQGSNENPQILIYHTHSQESFADSVPGDESTTIVGAGEKLAELLRDKYGYNVIHYTESFDKEARDYAYTNALPAVEQVLADNPSIEVVIDLHRDEMPDDRRLVMDLQGRPTAQFMFFNGLSRTKSGATIEYLENPNLEENLAFSFQMQVASNEYYPGIARRIYLKAYRYNMHLRGKSLLIELGAQNNTVEEIMNAVDPLAHVIHLVLSGNEPDRDS